MKQIRHSVFETNSSSTHSICISKKHVERLPELTVFTVGELGWSEGCETDTGDYLYTALLELERNDLVEKLEEILNRHGVKCAFKKPRENSWYGIDHSGELEEMIEGLFSNEDQLLRYLFGDSCIYTGNDNSSEDEDMCYCAEEFIWKDVQAPDGKFSYKKVPNPSHDAEHYEYYFKGN